MNVVNVVLRAELGLDLNLDFVKLGLGESAEFKPESFPGIVYRPRKKEGGKETILIFKTGRLVCTGTGSREEGERLIVNFVEKLRSLGVEIPEMRTEPHSAAEIDGRVMEALAKAENVYSNYCLYADSWATPRGHAGGFIRRWIDRRQIKELERLTTEDIRLILDKLNVLTDQDCMKILHSIVGDRKTLKEVSEETGIGDQGVGDYLTKLRKARLQWGPTKEEDGSRTYVAWGGRVVLHLLSIILKLVLEPSGYSIVGNEELYK